MPTNKKSGKTSSSDISLRMEEITNSFQRQMDDFKNQLALARGAEGSLDGKSMIGELSHRFAVFENSVAADLEMIKVQISQLCTSVEMLNKSVDVSNGRFCRNKLLVYGLKEAASESSSELVDKIVRILNSTLGSKNIAINKEQIVDCYRYGKNHNNSDKHRPVLLEFVHLWRRNLIFFNKSLFKGSKLVIAELLVGQRYDIYREARKRFRGNCWTVNGNIFICINGVKRLIRSLSDLDVDTAGSASVQ